MARGDQRERDRAKKQARLLKEAGGGKKVRSLIWMCCDMCMMMEIPSIHGVHKFLDPCVLMCID